MKKWKAIFYIFMICALAVSGCARSEPDVSSCKEEDEDEVLVELKSYTFDSAESAENISDEDLLYIAQNRYQTKDFIKDIEVSGYDLFGIPLMEKQVDGSVYKERIEPIILQSDKSLDEVNVNEEIPEQEFREYIERRCEHLVESVNSWNGDTGSIAKDEEIIYCGETDYYVEYSIRYTEVRTYYKDNIKVTVEIPRAYRRCFMKHLLSVPQEEYMCPMFFGNMTMEKIKYIEDLNIQHRNSPSIFRQMTENDEEYIYTNYQIYTVAGDYGMCDEAVFSKIDSVYNKQTHEIVENETIIKSIRIPETENMDDEY